MRYVRFSREGQEPELGIRTGMGSIVPLSLIDASLPAHDLLDLIDALGAGAPAPCASSVRGCATLSAHDVRILAPLERPRHDLLCLGVNYADHLEETKRSPIGSQGLSEKRHAVYFSKRAACLLGPGEKIVGRPDVDPALDYEVELAVILGRGGRNISADDAESHIFGYSVFNDVSSRGLQKSHGQWFVGKSLDTYAVLGPEVVTAEELPLPLELDVRSIVNGEQRQHSNTRNLIHAIPEIIDELSGLMTLEAGDIIATGTPSGVGMGFQPPRYLTSGDMVTCEIEGVGSLTNTVA